MFEVKEIIVVVNNKENDQQCVTTVTLHCFNKSFLVFQN